MKNLSLSLKNKKKIKIKSAVALKKNPGSSQDLAQQADVYRQLLRVCLAQPACTNFE